MMTPAIAARPCGKVAWLRGLSGASDEFTLAAAVQNLRRLAKRIAQGPPLQGIGAPA